MKNILLRICIGLICLHFAVGCGSIVHGTTQNIQINSSPDESEIWIDGANYGKTPARVILERKNDYLVTIKRDGYKESTIKIEGKTSAWIIGNVIFGGIIGCGIDFLTGGAYDLTPERIDVNLTELTSGTMVFPEERLDELREIRLIGKAGKVETVISINE